MNISQLQEKFIKQLSGTGLPDDFLDALKTTGKLLPEQQLAIYKQNVLSALEKTLQQVYPVCQKILGDKYFQQLAHHYIAISPSKHPDLNGYGENFPKFIHSQYLQRSELAEFPYLRDLTLLELLYHQAHFAAQGPLFDFTAFAELSDEHYAKVILILAPGLKFKSSDYPVVSIWNLNQNASEKPQSISGEPQNFCLYRKQYHVEISEINVPLYSLLEAVNNEATLQDISQIDHAQNLLALIQSGWICGFTVAHV